MIKKEAIEKIALWVDSRKSGELAAMLGEDIARQFGPRDETPPSHGA